MFGKPFAFTGANGISISDADAGTAIVQTTLSLPGGEGRLNVAPFAAVTIVGNGTDTLQLTGTLASLTDRFRCAGAPIWPLWVPAVQESGACAAVIQDAMSDTEALAEEEGLLVQSTDFQNQIQAARNIDAAALLDGLPTTVGERASFNEWAAVLRRR